MSVAHPALLEREALCDLLEELGPDAPTLCEGWSTADLAAHLYLREHRPDALPGIALAPLAPYTARVQRRVAAGTPFPAVVRRLRAGAPLGRLRHRIDLDEWFVHHEDVRRANGSGPRPEGPELWALDDAVWGTLALVGPVLARRCPVGVVLVSDDGRRRRIRRREPAVEVHGRPTELALELFGRRSAAATEALAADEAALQAWRAAPLGGL